MGTQLQDRSLFVASSPRPAPKGSPGTVLVQQSSAVFATQVLGLICGVLTNFLVAWMFGPEGRGLIYLLQLISGGVGVVLLNFGMGAAAAFYLGRDRGYSEPEVASGILLPSMALGTLPLGVLGLFWPWAGPLLTGKVAPGYFWVALAAIPAMTLTWNAGYFCLGRRQIRSYNLLRIGSYANFLLGLTALLFVPSRTVWTAALLWLASVLGPAMYALFLVRRAAGAWGCRWEGFLGSALRFGWRSHLGAVAQHLQNRVDVFLVGYFLPVRELGLYSLAVSLGELLWYIPQAVATVLMPHVASTSEEEASRITPIFCRATLTVTALLSLGLAAASTWVIPWILPVFQPSVRVLWLLLPGIIVASFFKLLSSDFNGRGIPLQTFYPPAAALVATLVAGASLIPRFGMTGAALISTAGYLLNAVLYLYSYSRLTAVPVADLLLLRRKDLFTVARFCRLLRS